MWNNLFEYELINFITTKLYIAVQNYNIYILFKYKLYDLLTHKSTPVLVACCVGSGGCEFHVLTWSECRGDECSGWGGCVRKAYLSARHRREPGEEQVADAGLRVFRDE